MTEPEGRRSSRARWAGSSRSTPPSGPRRRRRRLAGGSRSSSRSRWSRCGSSSARPRVSTAGPTCCGSSRPASWPSWRRCPASSSSSRRRSPSSRTTSPGRSSLRELVLLPLAVGVLIRIGADRLRWRPVPAIWVALALLIGTGLGVLNTFARFDTDIAWHAARSWLGNMAGPVIVLVAAAWTARGGSTRVIVVACAVAVASALVCLAEYASPGLISGEPVRVGWLLEGLRGAACRGRSRRRTRSSAQLIVPTAVLGGGRPPRPRPPTQGRCPGRARAAARRPLPDVQPARPCWLRMSSPSSSPGGSAGLSGSPCLIGGLVVGAVLLPSVPANCERDHAGAGHPGHDPGRHRRVPVPGLGRRGRDVAGRAAHRAGVPRVQAARARVRRPAPGLSTQRVAPAVRRGGDARRAGRDRVHRRDDLVASQRFPAGSARASWPGSSATSSRRRSTIRCCSSA